jgi:methylated-DNA-protein-cysteine methyltransferase-like protein
VRSGVHPRGVDRDERRARILAVVDSIPRGRVASYGQVAREAGLPRHARLVGRVLAGLSSASALPWHRVVNSAGGISLRPGAARQRRRLAREGVAFSRSGRIDLARFRWAPAGEREETAAGSSRSRERRARIAKPWGAD